MVIFFILVSYYSFSQSNITHKVISGETLSALSRTYGVSVNDIKEFNGLTSNTIFIGQILNIPGKQYYETPDMSYLTKLNLLKRTCVKTIYESQIGIRELTGKNDGVEVEMYLSASGLGKGYPWCAAFVNWVFLECGLNLNLQHPAWVPSYFPRNKLIYVRGQLELREPVFGDLIGIWFEKQGRLAHIAFFDGQNKDFYFTVEGNTNEAGSREGDGVYRKKRIKRQIHSISSWIEN